MRDSRSYIRTASGLQVWPLDPRPEDIALEDIAHALAMQCRFGGHTLTFYSVAQHSVMVSKICSDHQGWAQAGLLHDAAEAYLGDMLRPLKRQSLGQGYRDAEHRLLAVIFLRFGLDPLWAASLPDVVTAADNWMCGREGRMLMPPDPDWARLLAEVEQGGLLGPLIPQDPLSPCGSKQAEALFLKRFDELWPGGAPWR